MFLMFIKTYHSKDIADLQAVPDWSKKQLKSIALRTSICILFVSLAMFALFDLSTNQFQFVLELQEMSSYYIILPHISPIDMSLLNRLVSSFNLDTSVLNKEVSSFNFYLGVDGLSIYFVLLTTIIMPVSLLSNWTSISHSLKTYLVPILLLETLLLSVFLVLDILSFYIFFESILPPLFILIGSFGSSDRVRASLYLFLYTLLGSLFLLLSIVTMSSRTGITDFDALFKINFNYFIQLFLFCGIFIAFAVKTPVMFLNSWLLKAHVQSPLSGSIILAGIVLKLSFYGILRLILPLLPKAYINCTFFIYLIGVITIVYASVSTLRTIDVKELIAYSSVSHAAVYLMGVFSKTIQGIEGGIALALAHGFVSSGLFICAGGALYDRSFTRLITYYRGLAQMMPIFSVIFFILCLGNCGVPLTLNFVGEFLSLYGAFERSPILGALASSSIIFSAAYTIYMFNRIAFAGSYSKFFIVNIPDLNKREFYVLLSLVLFTVALGIYPAPVLDGLHYSVTTLIYSVPNLYIFTSLFKRKSLWQWTLNSPPKPHAFVSLPVQSKYWNVTGIFWAIRLVWDQDSQHRSLEDRVDAYINGLLNLYYPWQVDRVDNGKKIPSGNIIAPQCWIHEYDTGRMKPDFTVRHWDALLANHVYPYIWVEDKRPFESFFKALDQVCLAVFLEGEYPDGRGMYGGFIIVAVGKELSFFEIPLRSIDGELDINWWDIKPLRYPNLDLSGSRRLYEDDDDQKRWLGDIWHVMDNREVVDGLFRYIKYLNDRRLRGLPRV